MQNENEGNQTPEKAPSDSEGFVPIKDMPALDAQAAMSELPVAFVSYRTSMGAQFSSRLNDGVDTLDWERTQPDDIGLYREEVVDVLRLEIDRLRSLCFTASDVLEKPMTESEFLTQIQKAFIMSTGTPEQQLQASIFFSTLYKKYPQTKETK